jgi:hypothetical protein
MTSSTDKKRNTKKDNPNYNLLDKKGTVSTRHDYIETDYVNGVKDDKTGELVIRPMNASEKAWLSQFISETEHGNLNGSEEIKRQLKVRKALKSDWVSAKRRGNVDLMAELEAKLDEKTTEIEALRGKCNNFYTKEEDIAEIFARDYDRRMDVYNNAKINDQLVLYDLDEYDKFSTEGIKDIDAENVDFSHVKRRRKQ